MRGPDFFNFALNFYETIIFEITQPFNKNMKKLSEDQAKTKNRRSEARSENQKKVKLLEIGLDSRFTFKIKLTTKRIVDNVIFFRIRIVFLSRSQHNLKAHLCKLHNFLFE